MSARKIDPTDLKEIILEYGKTHHTFTAPEIAHKLYPEMDPWQLKCQRESVISALWWLEKWGKVYRNPSRKGMAVIWSVA